MISRKLTLWLVLIALVAFSTSLLAQSSATITGSVTDPQGALVSGVQVVARNTATNIETSTKTTGSGYYTLTNLPPGTYDVRVEGGKDYGKAESKGFTLQVGQTRDLDFKLQLAGVSQTIEVTAAAPLIEPNKTEVSTSITATDMEKLPTFAGAGGVSNDYAGLAVTAPGVKYDTSGLTSDLIGPGSINNRANLYNVDGGNITDQLVSGRDGLGASVDEVQEFQVLTNNYNAEYGQAGGLIINVVTKSGTNGVHGEGHMYFRGRNLTAANPFYNLGLFGNSAPRGTVAPVGTIYCPPSDFSGAVLTTIDGCDRAPFHRKEGGFTVGGPFIKDKLFWFASYELTRQGFPLILTPASGNITVAQPTNDLLGSAKIDWHPTANHTLSARWSLERTFQDNQIVQTSQSVTPDDLTTFTTHDMTINVGHVWSITPTLVNEARFVWLRTINTLPDKTTAPGVLNTGTGTISGANFCCPQGGLQKRYQYIDNLTWTHGKHTWKTGFNISYYPWFSLFQQFHFGQYRTSNGVTASRFQFGTGPGQVTSKDNIYGFYVQDTWHIRSNFTVNYGLRYDAEAGAFKGGTIPAPGGGCFQSNGIIPACSSDYNNWQPRLGFTWEVMHNTMIHGSAAEVTELAFNNVVLDSLNFDGINLRTPVTTNPAVLAFFPNAPPAALLAGPPCPPNCGRVRPISPNIKNPELHMFNLGVQHQFGQTLMVEAQYIGQMGSGLFGERDVNAAPVLPDPANPGFFFFGSRPDSRFTAVRTNENTRTSAWNGLVLSANKRMKNHFAFNASWTWSHAFTSSEDFFGISEPGDETNIGAERGPAYNDIRHSVNFGVTYDSGKVTSNRWMGLFTNGITLGVVGQLQSGRPWPLSTGDGGFGNGLFFGSGNESSQRPNILPDGTISVANIPSTDGVNMSIGPNGVAICGAGCVQNTFLAPASADPLGAIDSYSGDLVDFRQVNGNAERNAGLGSPLYRFDTSLQKTGGIPGTKERVKYELRFDAFNVFNRSNWTGFNANDITSLLAPGPAGCTSCIDPTGRLIGTNGAALNIRDLTHGIVDKNFFAQNWGGIGDPSTVDLPRTLQLSFHIRF